eukprot:3391633-Amphidinium_carterae.1
MIHTGRVSVRALRKWMCTFRRALSNLTSRVESFALQDTCAQSLTKRHCEKNSWDSASGGPESEARSVGGALPQSMQAEYCDSICVICWWLCKKSIAASIATHDTTKNQSLKA